MSKPSALRYQAGLSMVFTRISGFVQYHAGSKPLGIKGVRFCYIVVLQLTKLRKKEIAKFDKEKLPHAGNERSLSLMNSINNKMLRLVELRKEIWKEPSERKCCQITLIADFAETLRKWSSRIIIPTKVPRRNRSCQKGITNETPTLSFPNYTSQKQAAEHTPLLGKALRGRRKARMPEKPERRIN